MSIQVVNLSKQYADLKAIDAISFSVKKGEIVGFLGPNGAGKSTVMKILTGYITDFEGEVYINEQDVKQFPIETKRRIGYLPEHNPLYIDMYVKEYLSFHAAIYKQSKQRVSAIIKEVGLQSHASKKIKELSKGYRQRVGIAAALLHNPDVLILDEPTTGLDPNQLVEIRELIKNAGKEKTVLFSTHIMQEVEAVLQKSSIHSIEVEFNKVIDKALLLNLPNVKNAISNNKVIWEITFNNDQDQRANVFDLAKNNGFKILSLVRKNKNLEQMFRELTS